MSCEDFGRCIEQHRNPTSGVEKAWRNGFAVIRHRSHQRMLEPVRMNRVSIGCGGPVRVTWELDGLPPGAAPKAVLSVMNQTPPVPVLR